MIRRYQIISLLMVAVLAIPLAYAANKKPTKEEVVKPLIDKKECQYLTHYYPSEKNSAEYKPGVDVHGKPVMEADITPPVITVPEKFSFDITVDVAKYMGLNVPAGTLSEAKMGTITSDKGRLSFNDTPLEGEAEATLRALCAETEKPKSEDIKMQKTPVKPAEIAK